MALLDELLRFVTSGSIADLPSIAVMIIPFIVGLIVGFFVKKFLKIAIIVGILVVIISYFGFFNLSLSALGNLATQYGPIAIHYATLLIGMLPLGVGFVIGLVIGFLFG